MEETYDFKGLDIDILINVKKYKFVLFPAIATWMFSS